MSVGAGIDVRLGVAEGANVGVTTVAVGVDASVPLVTAGIPVTALSGALVGASAVCVAKIEADMKPLAMTVATMEPIVAGYAVTRWKIAGAFALGTNIITAFG